MTDRVTAISVISGFAGAGKTTFLNKILAENRERLRIAIIENEFGEVGIDGDVLEGGITVKELTSGCICCTLFSGFLKAAMELIDSWQPDWIIVEPTGVSKLSDVLKSIRQLQARRKVSLQNIITIVDPGNYEFHSQIFGDFFFDQIEEADVLVLSRTQHKSPEQINKLISQLRQVNPAAIIFDEPWDRLQLNSVLQIQTAEAYPQRMQLLRPFVDVKTADRFVSLVIELETADEEHLRRCFAVAEADTQRFGILVRGKGYFPDAAGGCHRFEYVPGELNVYETYAPPGQHGCSDWKESE